MYDMKTNRSARRFVRTRRIALLLMLMGAVSGAFWLGGSLGTLSGRTTASPTENWRPPNTSLADCLVAAR